MAMLANPATIDSSQFDNFIASRTEPNWMTEQRLHAWKAFEQAEQPFWRRTNLKGFNINEYRLADADVTIDFAGADGVTVLPLAEALRFHGDAVQKVFGSAVRTDRDKYSALNNAYVNAGVFVHVAKNIECDAPIHITYRVKNAGDLVAPRTLIYAEPNSAIRVIEEIVSDEFTGKALILSGAEIEARDNARVNYTSIQTLHENVTMFGNQQMNLVGKDAHGDWLNIVVGGAVQHV
ncbi:MAG: SufD family Fe-S cluster assembly protein, partial [Herpetosiphon sp.]|nr:SufD family Fe-S cluster assembly protein [Herpetosiphon sp.]